MNQELFSLVVIAGLFILFVFVKEVTKLKFCALCVAVSLTWISLLVLWKFDLFDQPLVLGVLIGESVFGVYHLVEKKTAEGYHLFRLPFFLTLTAVAFILLEVSFPWSLLVVFLGLLWLGALTLFVGRKKKRIGDIAKRLIACCKDW